MDKFFANFTIFELICEKNKKNINKVYLFYIKNKKLFFFFS